MNSMRPSDGAERPSNAEPGDLELDRLFHMSLDLLCVAGPDGRFKRVNPAFVHTLGFSQDELQSRPFIEFVHPDDVEATLNEVKRLNAGERTIDFENRYRCADGDWKWMSWRARADGLGNVYAVARDETERHRLEQMKREFISTVSHELRTPLTSISASLELIDSGALGEVAEPIARLVKVARHNSKRLLHLINDLLDLEKAAAGKLKLDMQLLDVLPVLELSLEANRGYAERYKVRYVLSDCEAPVQIRADPERLLQVMSNLLSNAAKFSPPGGVVKIIVGVQKGWVRIAVADHGRGIPSEFQSRVFERFSQAEGPADRQRGGSGLGLAIAKEWTERMGGHIAFESARELGTTFFLEFPAQSANEPDNHAELANEISKPAVLVVDDDPDVAQLLALLLQQGGYRTALAHSGSQALSALRQTDYAAATVDLILPDMNGAALIRAIRSDPRIDSVPMVVVSGVVDQGKLALGSTFPAVDWLPKPVDQRDLLTAIDRAVRKPLPGQSPRILHIEDDLFLREVIATMAGSHAHFDGASTLAEARRFLQQSDYHLVILDLDLPDGDGSTLIPELRAKIPQPSIVVLSARDDLPRQVEGVAAVLVKTRCDETELLQTLHRLIEQAESGRNG